MAKKKKTRVEMRKNRSKPARQNDWTQGFKKHGYQEEATLHGERVRAKGDLSRKRTVIQEDVRTGQDGAPSSMPGVVDNDWLPGRVLRVHGLQSVVQTDDGRQFRCAVRRLLKTLSTDERNVVTTGDRVWIRPAPGEEGFIERVEPRHGLLTRASRGREHVLVANVDQVVIVVALAQPEFKPHLIDRYLASAEQGNIKPIICLNKVDLVEPVELQPLIGYYGQLGLPVLLTSASTGAGLDELRHRLRDRQTVFSGQSGVGKSSLLNAIEPTLGLRVREVSEENEKGKHTTTTAQLIPLANGGYVVDTPGIRQFELWDIIPAELDGLFRDFRPYANRCKFPNCTHTHESPCAIKDAVADGKLDARRYESYCHLRSG